ncbi:unnamed protein product [Adineta steineri]|uniref:Oxysterol-binding protein n=1 Tax=Adineta steineri TaxID=433720 RepID=A0A814PMC3_9BILA|nr:unnamed protein product [Adineta steineri]CAF1107987.1 unnamed protein product [Adineta steineri]
MSFDIMKSRRKLPAPMHDRSSYSIFSVIRQAIGKDLTRFSIPVIWSEPLSFLQRLAECLEYSSLLDRASLANTSIERLHLITAFVVSTLSSHLERLSKPFNPLLGETYELKSEGTTPFHFIAEQVSHHPPISALYVRGQNWTLTANVEPKVKFQGTNVVAIAQGRSILRIYKKSTLSQSSSQLCTDENGEVEEYTWTTPSVVIHNILFGRLWCEFQGEIDLKHVQSNQHAVLTIKSHSWFASQSTKTTDMFKYNGYIYDGNDKISAFHGNYGHCYYAIDDLKDVEIKTSSCCSAHGNNCLHLSSDPILSPSCNLILTPSSRLIWHRSFPSMTDKELALRHQYYFFTPFTMCLNEHILLSHLPPTDCRFRKDIRYLEQGDLETASIEKHRLEEQQRADAKKRENGYEPLWFKKDDQGEYIYTGEYQRRNFDHCPNLFS